MFGILLVFLLLPPGPFLSAQGYFRGFTGLMVLETRYFEIIYPKESEETARRLILYADGAYEEVSTRLGISVGRKIPVAITPHTDEFNSYMNSMPYPHILLLDTPMNSEWTTFDASLEKLFLHEMTHAVSLSTRGKVLGFFHRIFGGWVYPPAFNVPPFMTEGIAVSFESLEGYGRANDPLIKQKLRQENYEGKFLSPYQVSGVSDMQSAIQGAWYEYGGIFSRYLQETYGMEKYAELWQLLGKGFHFSFFFYNNGFYYYFKKVYGVSVLDAWNGMRESLALEGIENSGGMIVDRGLPFKYGSAPSRITGMAASGERIFALDRFTRRLFIYNGAEEKTERTIPMATSAYDISVSPLGDRFLVSSYRYHDSRAEAVVTEYSARNGRPGRTWHNLYRGSYFRDGVVGISSERHQNRIVFRTGTPPGAKNSRNEEVLLEGGAALLFTNPRPLNDRWIAFTAVRGGKRELCFYNYDTKGVYRAATGLPDDEKRWEFIRYLQVSGERLLFGYDHDDRMYKLGMIRIAESAAETEEAGEDDPVSREADKAELSAVVSPAGELVMTVTFTERDFSGAVAFPVLAGGAVYYSGRFFESDRLMRYPENPEALGGISTALHLLPWEPEAPPESGVVSESSPDSVSGGPAAPSPLPSPAPGEGPQPLPARVYLPFKYFNPLYLWFPLPLVRSDPDTILRVDGGGIYSIMIDPAELNTIVLQAAMDARFMLANINISWTNLNLGFPLDFTFSDDVDAGDIPYRAIRFSAQSTFIHSLGSQGLKIHWGAGFGFSRFYMGDREDSAYTWDFHSWASKLMFEAGLSSRNVQPWETFGHGLLFRVIGWELFAEGQSGFLPKPWPRLDAYVQAAFEPFLPLRFTLYGAWDSYTAGMNLQGTSSQYASPIFQSVSIDEYQNQRIKGLDWIAGGELEARLFSLNVQKSVSHLYINRFLGTLAYRAAVYDAGGFSYPEGNKLWADLRLPQSLVFRLGAGLSSVIFTSRPVRVTAYLQTALKLSMFAQGRTAFNELIAISPQISISY
ncbi:MAG: hypothetical protein LBB77_00985 [Treponema sp.]|jgi:hypothetical protein|nr:hypothetical protein [Treponema sp.]